jgi:hypothetical protein
LATLDSERFRYTERPMTTRPNPLEPAVAAHNSNCEVPAPEQHPKADSAAKGIVEEVLDLLAAAVLAAVRGAMPGKDFKGD